MSNTLPIDLTRLLECISTISLVCKILTHMTTIHTTWPIYWATWQLIAGRPQSSDDWVTADLYQACLIYYRWTSSVAHAQSHQVGMALHMCDFFHSKTSPTFYLYPLHHRTYYNPLKTQLFKDLIARTIKSLKVCLLSKRP